LVAVVAFFAEDYAVATLGRARGSRTVGLDLAIFRTAVEGHQVAVITALGAFFLAVSADGLAADARLAAALPADFESAGGRATVAALRVVVVADLGPAQHAVAAFWSAWFARNPALPAGLHRLAIGGATITVFRVPVVTGLVGGHEAVSAHREVLAGLPRIGTLVVGLDLTNGIAPVAAVLVAVIASFALVRIDNPVAAANASWRNPGVKVHGSQDVASGTGRAHRAATAACSRS
jgi:hypothetical protein